MANLGMQFNAREVAPQQAFEVLAAGWYKAAMVESEMKPTGAGDGNYLRCVFQILEGKAQNQKVFTNINLNNPNPKAQLIGRQQLSAVCHATGFLDTADSAVFHNVPIHIKLKIRPAEGQYEAQNEVAAYKHISEVVNYADATAPAARTAAPQLPPGAGVAPSFAPPPQQFAPQQQPQQFAPQQQQFAQPPVQQQQFAPQQQQFAPPPQQAPQQAPQQFAPQQAPQFANAQQPWAQPGQQAAPQQPSMEPPPQQFAPQQQQPQQFAQPPAPPAAQAPAWANGAPQQAAQQQQQQQQQQVPQADISQQQAATPPWAQAQPA